MATIVIGPGCLAIPVFAQDNAQVDELQRVIEAQQKQLEAQQKQLDTQRQLLQELQSQIKALAGDKDKEAETVTAEKPPAEPPFKPDKARPERRVGIAQEDRYDRDSPTGADVTYFDPAVLVKIPESKTEVGVHGFAEFQIIHDTTGLNNNRFDTATIPVDGAPSQTKFSVNPSRLAISSTTPVAEGRLNTVMSMDFNGELDKADPRLRLAFGEFVNDDLGFGLLAGQAYSTMLDMRAVPETLDFAGPAGLWQQRHPLFRFTKAVSDTFVTELALETPEDAFYINAERQTRWPDFAAAGFWQIGGDYIDHVRVAALARDLRAEAADGARDSVLGWTIQGSGKLKLAFLGPKDNFRIHVHYGDGYGTYIKGGPREGVFNTATSELEAIGIFGSFGGVQHFWSERFRSNLVYGYVNADNPEFVSGDTFDNTNYVAADLIWSPYKMITIGAEYLWGRRENKDDASGTGNRFLFSSRFDF